MRARRYRVAAPDDVQTHPSAARKPPGPGYTGASHENPPTFRSAKAAALTWIWYRQPKGRGRTAVNILRRLPLSRLLLLGGLVVVIGVSVTALASALSAGPTPAPKPLAQAIHDALSGGGEQIEGVSASVTLTDHLLEGANLASGGHSGESSPEGELSSNPLVTGASGRLWIAKHGRLRLELQSQQGDTQILYDGHTISLYDAATNTEYRYTPSAREQDASASGGEDEIGVAVPDNSTHQRELPSVAKIEEAIARLSKHADVSGATPTDIAGQAAYTVRISPKESGSLLGGVELSFDAVHGVPLRAAIYSSTTATPVIELAATDISYGPVADSVFEVNPPANAKVEELKPPSSAEAHAQHKPADAGEKPSVSTQGSGPSTIAVLTSKETAGANSDTREPLEGLPKVTINGTSASELRTELGTLLTFERSGVRYLLAGSVTPAQIEAVARGL
jgi:outer membrane lipoprotein-sorting protein